MKGKTTKENSKITLNVVPKNKQTRPHVLVRPKQEERKKFHIFSCSFCQWAKCVFCWAKAFVRPWSGTSGIVAADWRCVSRPCCEISRQQLFLSRTLQRYCCFIVTDLHCGVRGAPGWHMEWRHTLTLELNTTAGAAKAKSGPARSTRPPPRDSWFNRLFACAKCCTCVINDWQGT